MGEISFKIIIVVFNLIFIAFVSGIIIFIREYRLKKRNYTNRLEEINKEHKKELLKAQIEIQNDIMKNIGRDIHDNVGQKLTISSLHIQKLHYDNEKTKIAKELLSINNTIDECLQELRILSRSLVNNRIENTSVDQLLLIESKKIEDLNKCKIYFINSYSGEDVSYETKTILLRIVQEFLQNSLKHSECSKISITISSTIKSLIIKLEDDGKGFEMNGERKKGIGLKNIIKRAELIQGRLTFESKIGSGTKLELLIPI